VTEQQKYRYSFYAAIGLALLVFASLINDHFSRFGPGDMDVTSGNNQFKSRNYKGALRAYRAALDAKPDHTHAHIGLANTFTQLRRYDEALDAINIAIKRTPDFGGYFATRGIILDHMGRHRDAMKDYEKALEVYPDAAKGMHWLDQFLMNVHDAPPTIKERLAYLRAEYKKPARERVLAIPEIDAKQRHYER